MYVCMYIYIYMFMLPAGPERGSRKPTRTHPIINAGFDTHTCHILPFQPIL